VFALVNGQLGLRGKLDEGEPHDILGRTGPRLRSASGPDRPARPARQHDVASLAGAWSAVVEGFGGLCQHPGVLALAPRLPAGITRLSFRIRHSGLRRLVEVHHETVRLRLRDGSGAWLPVLLYGERVEVGPDEPVVRVVVPLEPLLPEPRQPAGRAPDSRHHRVTTPPAT